MTATRNQVYGFRWRTTRAAILERDRYVCQIKGPRCIGTATQVDHIIPWLKGGAVYDPENLRAACHVCNGGRVRGTWAAPRRPSREW